MRITNEAEYQAALNRLEELWDTGENSRELDTLAQYIQLYEDATINLSTQPEPDVWQPNVAKTLEDIVHPSAWEVTDTSMVFHVTQLVSVKVTRHTLTYSGPVGSVEVFYEELGQLEYLLAASAQALDHVRFYGSRLT